MAHNERTLVKLIAKLSPWLAPLPSGYFVARSSISHLELPPVIGIAIGVIIEFLGIASVHTWLWLADWNAIKRRNDPEAPTFLAAFLGMIYICATVGLTVVLEVAPDLSIYAPVLFPALAVVGAVNLVLISQQEQREQTVNAERQERKAQRLQQSTLQTHTTEQFAHGSVSTLAKVDSLQMANLARQRAKSLHIEALISILLEKPGISVSDLSRRLGRSRTTIYKYLEELEQAGQIQRNGNRISV